MNELIRIATNEQGLQVASARDLHEFLEVRTKFTDWMKSRIEKYGFIEGEDITLLSENSDKVGRPEHDYALTLDTAKELAMVEGNDKGKQARRYFIECEKRLRNIVTVPANYLDALKALVQSEEQKQLLATRAQQAESTVAILTHVNKTYTATELAKEAGLKSATELNKYLHGQGVQFKSNDTWVLYSKYADQGYCEIKQEVLDNGHVIFHRRWTQRGREFVIKLLSKTMIPA